MKIDFVMLKFAGYFRIDSYWRQDT